eukprot:scaffold400210_cov20-Prasinocladus_malaysianus.AAC.2
MRSWKSPLAMPPSHSWPQTIHIQIASSIAGQNVQRDGLKAHPDGLRHDGEVGGVVHRAGHPQDQPLPARRRHTAKTKSTSAQTRHGSMTLSRPKMVRSETI